jgi:hypothetical protein
MEIKIALMREDPIDLADAAAIRRSSQCSAMSSATRPSGQL